MYHQGFFFDTDLCFFRLMIQKIRWYISITANTGMIRLNGKKSPSITAISRLTTKTTTVSQHLCFTVRIVIHTIDANAPVTASVIPILPSIGNKPIAPAAFEAADTHWLNTHFPGTKKNSKRSFQNSLWNTDSRRMNRQRIPQEINMTFLESFSVCSEISIQSFAIFVTFLASSAAFSSFLSHSSSISRTRSPAPSLKYLQATSANFSALSALSTASTTDVLRSLSFLAMASSNSLSFFRMLSISSLVFSPSLFLRSSFSCRNIRFSS